MIPRWLFLAAILLLAGILQLQPCEAKKDGPKITATKLASAPVDLFYFANSDTVMYQDSQTYALLVSFDGGATWKEVDDDEGLMKDSVITISPHPYDNQKAYILGKRGRHWITTDQAKTWRSFRVDAGPSFTVARPLAFHGSDSKKVIFHGEQCLGFACLSVAFYTKDDFKTVKPLRTYSRGCWWALGTPEFAEANDDVRSKIDDRVLCIVPGLKNPVFASANRLVYSDDFFADEDDGIEVGLSNGGRPVAGIIQMAGVKRHLITAARSEGTDELALYISDDAIVWHRAEFGKHKIEQDGYTVLESTNYSIQIDVQNTGRLGTMGVLFTSNSNGTYFTRNIEHTNRDFQGKVDFEKIENIQGIVLVNVVRNWEEIEEDPGAEKKLVSKISFDDGHTFQSLKAGDKDLHLHSITEIRNVGRVFSSPAPGLVMGVGNTGDHLKDYSKDGDLYVSDDAGLTWRKGLDKPHKYEFGDQGGVIMAVADDGAAEMIQFSIDHGKEWETAELPEKVKPQLLTTSPGSTTLKFLLMGEGAKDGDGYIVYSIDFSNMHERECGDGDFEDWPARLDENGKPDCLMGHKQYYRRRKSDAECFVREGYKEPMPFFERCTCTKEDFECDYNFERSEDGTKCLPTAAFKPPPEKCRSPDDTYKGPSGWRLIPGNVCIRDGGEKMDEEVERSCKDVKVPSGDKIQKTKTSFGTNSFETYTYLERTETSTGDDETIVMKTVDGTLYLTRDHGKTWTKPLKDTKIRDIIQHQYINDRAYFLTAGREAYVTINRGETFDEFEAPLPPVEWDQIPLSFHQSKKEWLIWTGVECVNDRCQKIAYISKHRGTNLEPLLKSVELCLFMAREDRPDSENLIFCDQHVDEVPGEHRQLLSSTNWFDDSTVHIENVERFATQAEFIIAAARDPEKTESLKAEISVDGRIFADAKFPPGFDVPVQVAYNVLDSSTHSIFLHVTVNKDDERAYGTIIKSNQNGTSYVRSIDGVTRNRQGYVDFEKMEGLEGVALVNVVANIAEVDKGKNKLLKTKITHNDGAQWTYIPPPAKDAEGRPYSCSVKEGEASEKCSLHLHGYTERIDPSATYSSASAIGLMFGVGNVGEFLTEKDEADTFFTRDGGITWKSVKKGQYIWEYGDQGSILVIVEAEKPTNVVYFSVDEGESWEEFEFSDEKIKVLALSTVPSDTSKNFLLWGEDVSSGEWVTVNLDFSNLHDRTCELDETTGEGKDYYLWQPRHPLQEGNCLFGHVEQYHRKKPESRCWNEWSGAHVHMVAHNCTCTRQDFECDYNYEPQSDGTCALVQGLSPPDPMAICREDPDAIEYWPPTPYRRIPLTTCSGGRELDKQDSPLPCPNKEDEYRKKHGISGFGLFMAIIIPIAAAAFVGYWVYTRWDGKFGQIRLGEAGSSTGGLFSRDSALIKIPVTIIAGTVAVLNALPLLGMSLWRSASGYVRIPGRRSGVRPYATRGAFAARRGDYSSVVDDEDELLGADEFEDDEDA